MDDIEDCAGGLESQDDEGLNSSTQNKIDSSIAKAFTSFLSGEHARNLFSDLINSAVATAMSPITFEIERLKSENIAVKQALAKTEVEINEIKYGLDTRDQTSRRNNLVVSTKWSDSDQTSPQDQITAFAIECLSADIQDLRIAECYRLGKRPLGVTGSASVQHGRPILVKFTTYNDKMLFVSAARKVKTGKLPSPVYLSDDLTPDRKVIFNDGRRCKSQKLITDVWSSNGRIHVKQLNGAILSFSSLAVWNLFVKTLSLSDTQCDPCSSMTK